MMSVIIGSLIFFWILEFFLGALVLGLRDFFSWDPQIWAFHLRSQVSSSDHYGSASLWNYCQICVPTSKDSGPKAALGPQQPYVCVGKANKTNSVWSALHTSLKGHWPLWHTWDVRPKQPLARCLFIGPFPTSCLDTKFT